MSFLAYSYSEEMRISYKERDESAGIIGKFSTSQPPTCKAETRAEITEATYAMLGRDPNATLYITDSENRLLEIVLCHKYHNELAAQAKWHFMAWTLLFLCVASFLGSILIGLSFAGFGLFLFIALLYVACVQLKIQNEVESAVLCTIILVMILFMIPSVRSAREDRERGQRPQPTEQSNAWHKD